MTADDVKEVQALMREHTHAVAASKLGISPTSLHRILRAMRAAGFDVPDGPKGQHRGRWNLSEMPLPGEVKS